MYIIVRSNLTSYYLNTVKIQLKNHNSHMFRLFYKAIFRLLSIKVFLYNIHILYFPSYYNNHVNEISYFPRLQLYIKTFMDHSLKMAS